MFFNNDQKFNQGKNLTLSSDHTAEEFSAFYELATFKLCTDITSEKGNGALIHIDAVTVKGK